MSEPGVSNAEILRCIDEGLASASAIRRAIERSRGLPTDALKAHKHQICCRIREVCALSGIGLDMNTSKARAQQLEERRVVASANASASSAQVCSSCTLKNDVDALQCSACEALLPDSVQCGACTLVSHISRTLCPTCSMFLPPKDDPDGMERVSRMCSAIQSTSPKELVSCAEKLECLVCLESCHECVLLRHCGHSVCRTCLRKCIEATGYTDPRCPACWCAHCPTE